MTIPRLTDDELLAGVTAEMLRCKTPIEMVIRPISMFQMVGLLQLALRHPNAHGLEAETARTFIERARAYFHAHDATAILEIIRRGDDPAEDR